MNILAFFAHPDDETMLAGGTLILLAQTDAQVHYLYATRGEGGEVGEPPVCPPETLGDVRETEMNCAVEVIGGSSLNFLEYIDPKIGPKGELYPYSEDLSELTERLVEYIRDVKADALITHGVNGEYGHPAHVISHQGALLAVAELGEVAPALYSISASFPGNPKPHNSNRDEPAHLVLDISPVQEIKTAAALCHRSQNALFVRRASKKAGRPMSIAEVIITMESLHRVMPEMSPGDKDPLFEILAPWAVQP